MFSIPALDDLSPSELSDLVHKWFQVKGKVAADLTTIDQSYHLMSPRNIFLKTLSENAEVLDVGAGDGALGIQKKWPMFERPDIRLYALSLEPGTHFNLYEGYEIKNFETDPAVFAGKSFDAIVCAHFIEHIQNPASPIAFFADKLRKGGRIYIEWPHPFTKNLPTKESLAELGVDVSTFNFFDDHTHIEAWSADLIVGLFEEQGFAVESGGRIHLPWIGDQMRDYARQEVGNTRMSLGAWAAIGWAQYLILNAP